MFLLLCALAAALAVTASAAPRARPAEEPIRAYRGWDGRPVTGNCNAAPGDAEGFKSALAAHQDALIGFENKMRSLYYRVPKNVKTWLTGLPAERALEIVAVHLDRLGPDGKTLALVYDTGAAGGQYAICVWLISAKGIVAAETVSLASYTSFARGIETSLGVATRAAVRAPRKKTSRSGARSRSTGGSSDAAAPGTGGVGQLESIDAVARKLLPPAIAGALAATPYERLLILPAADLGTVPFAALPIGDRQLIDLGIIVMLADIEGLYLAHPVDRDASVRDGRAIVVGDPDLSGDPNYEWIALPGARREAMSASAVARSIPLIGAAAQRKAVLQEISAGSVSMLYFATHGISDPVNPMDGSFLALKGGHLYARDIKKFGLGWRPLVVMSACQSGLGKVFEGGMFGLARAWLHAGARQVVMSLWNISDEATERLMVDFLARMRLGASPEQALREAMLSARDREKDPALWAGFTIYGAPKPSRAW